MKTLFAALLLVACGSVQANANTQTVSVEPVWLKDMQSVSCKFGVCKNWYTMEVWDEEDAPDGWTIVFPESYNQERLEEISPAVVQWIKVNGIPKP